MIAAQLVHTCRDIDRAFEPSGPFEFLIRRRTSRRGAPLLQPAPQWVGVLGALWSAVAEKYGRELYDLPSFFATPDGRFNPSELQPVFQASVRERKGDAFTPRTFALLTWLWEDGAERLQILLSTSCVPGHAWNANFLTEHLLKLSESERADAWLQNFAPNGSPLNRRAHDIADWAINVDTASADEEVMCLAGLTLAWLRLAQNDRLRKQAMKGLARLMSLQPTVAREIRSRLGTEGPAVCDQMGISR